MRYDECSGEPLHSLPPRAVLLHGGLAGKLGPASHQITRRFVACCRTLSRRCHNPPDSGEHALTHPADQPSTSNWHRVPGGDDGRKGPDRASERHNACSEWCAILGLKQLRRSEACRCRRRFVTRCASAAADYDDETSQHRESSVSLRDKCHCPHGGTDDSLDDNRDDNCDPNLRPQQSSMGDLNTLLTATAWSWQCGGQGLESP